MPQHRDKEREAENPGSGPAELWGQVVVVVDALAS